MTNGANSGSPIADAVIQISPAVSGSPVEADATGSYSVTLPVGTYTLTATASNFESSEVEVSVLAAVTQTENFSLQPTAPVLFSFSGVPEDAAPGSSFTPTVDVTTMDGSTVQTYRWTQASSADATIDDERTATPTITLAVAQSYKNELLEHLDDQDRWAVLGIDPHALHLAATPVFEVEVVTSSGTYTDEIEVHTDLEFGSWTTGLRNVAVGVPVLVGGRIQTSYDWTLTSPNGSTATLRDAASRYPWFVPDVAGEYRLSVTDQGASAPFDIDLYAGHWSGGIIGMDAEGRPLTSCTVACHSGVVPEKFSEWAASGHARIFSDNLNTSGHYGDSCFACHTVGYDLAADNGGIDDSSGYQDFLDSYFHGGSHSDPNPSNWADLLDSHPDQARLTNIQCENCHGPNGTGSAHANSAINDARMSTSAQLCASCHGEPPRHGRFQQWQESGHGNYALAMDEGGRGSCNKCHTAGGFLDWAAADFDVNHSPPSQTPEEVEPITCVVCHDPHDVGTVSGDANDVTLRVSGDSPELLAGFTAYGVGDAATCVICHNTRRGEVDAVISSAPDTAPHGGAQTDVLFGTNAFFVTNGVRGAHSLINDSCVTCHIALTPPPADLSYNLSGTNHSFAANTSICADCHGQFDAATLIATTSSRLAALGAEIEDVVGREIAFHVDNGRELDVSGSVGGASQTVRVDSTSTVVVIGLTGYHGRSAVDLEIDGVLVEHARLNSDIEVIDAGSAAGTFLDNTFSSVEDILAQSLWNYALIQNDDSKGVHNPGWVNEIMNATSQQLQQNWQ